MSSDPLRLALGFVAAAALFVLLEHRWPAAPGTVMMARSRRAVGTDVIYWFFTPLVARGLTRLAVAVGLIATALLLGVPADHEQLLRALEPGGPVARQPRWLQAIELLVLADLAGYLSHRWLHGRHLWPIHAVHHSSTRVDWLAAVRVHPLNDALPRVLQAIPLVFLGFDARLIAALIPVFTFWAILVHAAVPWRFGPLRFLIASPAFHRWHHALDEQGLQRNYAGLFPAIDLLFGTYYLPVHAPCRFGTPDAPVPDGFLAQLAWPFGGPGRAARGARAIPPSL